MPVPVDVFTEEKALAFLAERTGLADSAGARDWRRAWGTCRLALPSYTLAQHGLGSLLSATLSADPEHAIYQPFGTLVPRWQDSVAARAEQVILCMSSGAPSSSETLPRLGRDRRSPGEILLLSAIICL
jgi:hypothetical protein